MNPSAAARLSDESRACFPLLALALAMLAPETARAGGFWLWETGSAADVGNAGAAWGAGSDDSSTAWTNPAAMTLLERSELGLQLTPAVFSYRFDRDSRNTARSGSGGNTVVTPIAGGSGVWVVDDELRLGVALGGLAGGELDYGDRWSGRYLVSKVELTTLAFQPSVAYRLTDWRVPGSWSNPVTAPAWR